MDAACVCDCCIGLVLISGGGGDNSSTHTTSKRLKIRQSRRLSSRVLLIWRFVYTIPPSHHILHSWVDGWLTFLVMRNRAKQRSAPGRRLSTKALLPSRRRRNMLRWWKSWRRSWALMLIRFRRLLVVLDSLIPMAWEKQEVMGRKNTLDDWMAWSSVMDEWMHYKKFIHELLSLQFAFCLEGLSISWWDGISDWLTTCYAGYEESDVLDY